MLLKLSIKLFTVCIMFTNVLSDNTCNILSLSGGGSFGAVEAGILKDLFSKKLIENEFDFCIRKFTQLSALTAIKVKL